MCKCGDVEMMWRYVDLEICVDVEMVWKCVDVAMCRCEDVYM